MGLPFEMKRVEGRKRAFQYVAFQKIMKFANFINGDTAIQWTTLHDMRSILLKISLPLVDDGFVHVYLGM